MDLKEIRYSFDGAHKPDETVRYVQSELNFMRSGLMGAPWPGVTTDGVFTVQTRNAIMDFQKAVGLSPTGVIDARLLDAMFRFNQVKPQIIRQQRERYRWMTQDPSQGRAPSPVPQSSFPQEHGGMSFEQFMSLFKDLFAGVLSDLNSINDFAIEEFNTDFLKWFKWLFSKIKTKIGAAMKQFCDFLVSKLPELKFVSLPRVKAVLETVKKFLNNILSRVKTVPEYINKLPFVGKVKSFTKSNIVGITLSGLPVIYYLYKNLTTDESTAKQLGYDKKLYESIQSFIGALIVMLAITVVAAIPAVAGAGFTAAAIGCFVAIIDLFIVMIFTQGIADYIGQWTTSLVSYIIESGTILIQAVKDAPRIVDKAQRSVIDYFYDQMMGALQFAHGI